MAAVAYTRTSPASLSHYGRPKASYAVLLSSSSSPLPQGAINEKEHMQELNSRLATYLEMVSKLEKTNSELELKIRERISEGKPRIRDYSKQFEIIETLRRQYYITSITPAGVLFKMSKETDLFKLRSTIYDSLSNIFEEEETIVQNENKNQQIIRNESLKDLMKELENKLLSEMRQKIEYASLSKYIEEKLVPRGLRIKKQCSFKIEDEIFIKKWREILEEASIKLMELIKEFRGDTLIKLGNQINELEAKLEHFKKDKEFLEREQIIKDLLKTTKKELIEIKKRKLERDRDDYTHFKGKEGEQYFSTHNWRYNKFQNTTIENNDKIRDEVKKQREEKFNQTQQVNSEKQDHKWSSESAIRQSVEGDIGSLVSVRNNHQSINEGLRNEVEILQNELLALKKQHEQDLAVLRESLAKGKVSVEVDAVQGPDLNSILAEIRSQYEDIMKKNKEEADVLFQSQSEALSVQVEQEDRAVKSAQDELRDKKSLLQELQLSLETLNNQVNTLSGNVQDTELRYRAELEKLQSHVTQLEKEMADAARNMQNNKLQYEALLRIKETLEAEIAEYRRLLEGEPQEKVIIPEPKQPDIRTKKIVKIVTQTLVDGKIVGESSEVEEFENAEKSKANILNIAVPRGSQ
ncbi:keratin, type I cytoskeletal 18-like [Bombina bombina]|uniref:keratin, type I cytoskeletal 18-like n=1 Tax=Bombina bombina TaxID=8345 RepID=UPI00235B154B|nr:keratin, type I cytoskeletal 18-like [Bombina bombina]